MMADQQNLDFTGMLASDPDYLALLQKQQIAQAMAKNTLQGVDDPNASRGLYRRSPLAAIADFMSLKSSKDQMLAATEQEKQLYSMHKAAEAEGVKQLVAALADPNADHTGAVANAMASPYPNLRRLAETTNKNTTELTGKALDAFKYKLDPVSALRAIQGGNFNNVQAAPPIPPPQLMQATPSGPGAVPMNWLNATNEKGEIIPHFAPAGTSLSVTTQAAPGLAALDQQGKFFAAGGEGYKEGQATQDKLQSTQDALRTIIQNPQLGAGASGMQVLRKWAETLSPGITAGLSADNEQAKMQLSNSIIKELGGRLGSGISDNDVKLISNALGSIDTDPNALRRMLLVSMKYQMRHLAQLSSQASDLEKKPTFENAGVTFPGYKFNVAMPGATADELESIFHGSAMPPMISPQPSRIRPR